LLSFGVPVSFSHAGVTPEPRKEDAAMQIQAPHPKDQSIAAYLAAMSILYHGSLAAALAAAPKSH
jgi:hypothetical protein